MSKRPIHPGEVLHQEYMLIYQLTTEKLGSLLGIGEDAVKQLVAEAIPLTASHALRLARLFGTTPDFWMNLQAAHDLLRTQEDEAEELATIDPFWFQVNES